MKNLLVRGKLLYADKPSDGCPLEKGPNGKLIHTFKHSVFPREVLEKCLPSGIGSPVNCHHIDNTIVGMVVDVKLDGDCVIYEALLFANEALEKSLSDGEVASSIEVAMRREDVEEIGDCVLTKDFIMQGIGITYDGCSAVNHTQVEIVREMTTKEASPIATKAMLHAVQTRKKLMGLNETAVAALTAVVETVDFAILHDKSESETRQMLADALKPYRKDEVAAA